MNRTEQKARTLAHQTEAWAELDIVMSCLLESVRRLAEASAATKRAKGQLVAANTLTSGPQYVDTCSDCYGAGVIQGELCSTCNGVIQVAS